MRKFIGIIWLTGIYKNCVGLNYLEKSNPKVTLKFTKKFSEIYSVGAELEKSLICFLSSQMQKIFFVLAIDTQFERSVDSINLVNNIGEEN